MPSGRGEGGAPDPAAGRWAEPPGPPGPPELPVVWAATLDARYDVRVTAGTRQRTGRLTVRDRRDLNRLLLSRPVPLSPGSLYGATPQEVAAWCERAELAVAYQRPWRPGPEGEP